MPKILIVDDDADMRAWISDVLQDANYRVEVLPDGAGVLQLLSLGVIDLALIDHHLPGKSGITLVREIRAARNSTPVVMLTGDPSQQLAVEAFRVGAFDFITKPIDPDYLKIVVERTLSASAKTLKDTAFRALGYTRHKPSCSFHKDSSSCDCGLKELFEDVEGFS